MFRATATKLLGIRFAPRIKDLLEQRPWRLPAGGPYQYIESHGEQVIDDDLRYVSPLLRHHIGIYGQYNFDFRRFETAPSPESIAY